MNLCVECYLVPRHKDHTKCRDCHNAYKRAYHARKKSDPVYMEKFQASGRIRGRRQQERKRQHRLSVVRSLGPQYTETLLRCNARQAFHYWIHSVLTKSQAEKYFVLMGVPWEIPWLGRTQRCHLIMDEKTKVSVIDSETRLIPLHGKYAFGSCSHVLVDAEHYEELDQYKWRAKPNGHGNCVYAARSFIDSDGRGQTEWMHRKVLQAGSFKDNPLDGDHRNGNSLDNRRANLRLVSRSVNVRNTFTQIQRVLSRDIPCRRGEATAENIHFLNSYAPPPSSISEGHVVVQATG